MTRKILGLMVAVVLLTLNAMPAFAVADSKIVKSVSVHTGTLFLSDWESGSLVLQNVKPVLVNDETTGIASQLEYTAIPTFEGNILVEKTGELLDLSSLSWYLDMNVRVIVARLGDDSLRIISVVTY